MKSLCTEKAMLLKAKTNLLQTDKSFALHCLRCVYQLFIWRNAWDFIHELKTPSLFGFEYENEMQCWQPPMVTQSVAVPEL